MLYCIDGIKGKPQIHSYFLRAFPHKDFMNQGKYDITYMCNLKYDTVGDFPSCAVVKNPPANAGDTGSIPGPGRSHMPWSN